MGLSPNDRVNSCNKKKKKQETKQENKKKEKKKKKKPCSYLLLHIDQSIHQDSCSAMNPNLQEPRPNIKTGKRRIKENSGTKGKRCFGLFL